MQRSFLTLASLSIRANSLAFDPSNFHTASSKMAIQFEKFPKYLSMQTSRLSKTNPELTDASFGEVLEPLKSQETLAGGEPVYLIFYSNHENEAVYHCYSFHLEDGKLRIETHKSTSEHTIPHTAFAIAAFDSAGNAIGENVLSTSDDELKQMADMVGGFVHSIGSTPLVAALSKFSL